MIGSHGGTGRTFWLRFDFLLKILREVKAVGLAIAGLSFVRLGLLFFDFLFLGFTGMRDFIVVSPLLVIR